MTEKLKKIMAMLIAGVLICATLVGCEEEDAENDAETTESSKEQVVSTSDNPENNDANKPEWDSSAYVGMSPAGVYEAMGTADGYEIIIKYYDHSTLQSTDKIEVDGNLIYICERIDEDGSAAVEYFGDSTNRIAYMRIDGVWMSEEAGEDYEFPAMRDTAINMLPPMGLETDLLFNNSNYTVDQNTYIMISEILDEESEAMDGRVHSAVMKSEGTKYVFSVEHSITESYITVEFTIEFKPVTLTLPTVS